jgi:hypothetical protein
MDHYHVPEISKIEAKIQVNEMKEKARSTYDKRRKEETMVSRT